MTIRKPGMFSKLSKVAAAEIEGAFPDSHSYCEDLHRSSLEVQKYREV